MQGYIRIQPFEHAAINKRPYTSIHFYIVTFFLYLIFSAFYIFPSGNPQPADLLMVGMVIPALIKLLSKQVIRLNISYIFGIMFVGMTMVINPIHYFFTPDKKFLLSSLYYLYNFGVYIFVSYTFRTYGENIRKPAYWAVVGIIIIQLLFTSFFPDAKLRQTGTLNNPNQFSYWSLLTLMMLVILKGNSKLKALDFLLIGVLLLFQTLALSKAGLITSALTVLIIPFMPQFSKSGRVVLFFASLLSVSYLLLNPHIVTEIPNRLDNINHTINRLDDIGQDGDDSLSGRGYHRLINFPEYVLLGAGEGAAERFNPENPIEIHSGVATIIFSYGLCGAFFFFTFLYSSVKNQPWYCLAFVFFIILYGLTHQNFRFTHFWVFLGIINGINLKEIGRNKTATNGNYRSLE